MTIWIVKAKVKLSRYLGRDKHRKLVYCCLGELNKCINLKKSGKILGRMVLNHQDNATFFY